MLIQWWITAEVSPIRAESVTHVELRFLYVTCPHIHCIQWALLQHEIPAIDKEREAVKNSSHNTHSVTSLHVTSRRLPQWWSSLKIFPCYLHSQVMLLCWIHTDFLSGKASLVIAFWLSFRSSLCFKHYIHELCLINYLFIEAQVSVWHVMSKDMGPQIVPSSIKLIENLLATCPRTWRAELGLRLWCCWFPHGEEPSDWGQGHPRWRGTQQWRWGAKGLESVLENKWRCLSPRIIKWELCKRCPCCGDRTLQETMVRVIWELVLILGTEY